MSTEVLRIAAAIVAAVGLVLMLTPTALAAWTRLPDRGRRITGLAVLLIGWVVMAGTLVPDAVSDRLSTPVGLAAGVVGVLVALALLMLVGWLVARRPWTWFLLLGLALPVRVPISVGGEDANLLLPLYAVIVLGLAVLWWMERAGTRARLWPTTPLDLPLMLFAGFVLVSVAWSSDITEGAVKATFFWIPFVLLYLTAVAIWRQGRALLMLAVTTVAMSVPVAVLALGQYATQDILWNHRLMQANVYSRFFRVNSIFYDPNILGRYLALALLITVALAWLKRDSNTVLAACGVVAAIDAAALVVTFSRSSALMLLTGLLIMSLRMFGWRKALATAAVITVAGSAVAIATSGQVRSALTSTERLDKVSEGRFGLVDGGVDIFLEHPVAGGGLGSFATDYSNLLSEKELRKTRVVISHNAPVTILSEEGAIGFALFVWLSVIAAIVGIRATRDHDDDVGVPAAAMLGALAGIFVHALFYSAQFEDPYTWVLAAGLVALAAGQAGDSHAPNPGDSHPSGDGHSL
ncbi:MAG: O-antigen ligase family protein [Thermoleophilia bacterium]|nr:O-antigen ligase family protein [Thermoleophilia bacterium]